MLGSIFSPLFLEAPRWRTKLLRGSNASPCGPQDLVGCSGEVSRPAMWIMGLSNIQGASKRLTKSTEHSSKGLWKRLPLPLPAV